MIAVLLGLVLLAAGLVKAHGLLAAPPLVASFFDTLWLRVVWVEAELLLGILLLSGLWTRRAWWAALVAVSGFAAIALFKAVGGASNCGCFGEVEVSPWPVLMFDLLAVAALWYWRPAVAVAAPSRLRFVAAGLAALLALGGGLAVATQSSLASLSADGVIVGEGKVVTLEPASWLGSRFPLLGYVDIGDRLRRGNWVVLLHREKCPDCQTAIPAYVQRAYELAAAGDAQRVAIVEVPPFRQDTPGEASGSPCARGQLSDAWRWRVRVPVALRLRDGKVLAVTEGRDVMTWAQEKGPAVERKPSDGPAVLGFPDYRRARRDRFLHELGCGPLSLAAALRPLGIVVDDGDVERFVSAADFKGTDLLRLKAFAEQHGAHALGVAVDVWELVQIGLPAVVHDGGVGFAAVTGYTPDGVRLVHPAARPVILTPAEFSGRFGRRVRALLVSRQAVSARSLGLQPPEDRSVSGPWLRPETTVAALGRIYTSQWQARLKLFNDGDDDLRVYDVSVSCKGTRAGLDRHTIGPKQFATLQVEGKQDGIGGFACAVRLRTNESGRSDVRIPVRGYVEQAVYFNTPAITLASMPINKRGEVAIEVGLADGFAADSVRVQVPKGAPLEAKPARQQNGAAQLPLVWRGSAEVGWHRHRLEVSAGPAGVVSTPLLIAVQVVPEVEVSPPSLWLRDEELGADWSRRLNLRRGPVEVLVADPKLKNALRFQVTPGGNGEQTVVMTAGSRGALKAFAGQTAELRLRVPDGREARVPVLIGSTTPR